MSSNLEVAFVLAAGRGERLRPLTDQTPKPLMPLEGQPILWHTLQALKSLSLKRVVVNAWHLKEQISEFVRRSQKDFKFELLVSEEAELLGTGGGLRHALPLMKLSHPEAPILMVNGDIFFRGDLSSFVQRGLQALTRSEAHWWLAPEQPDQTVITVEGREIVRLGSLWRDEKTSIGVMPQIRGCFSGLQILKVLDSPALPEQGCIIRDYWLGRLRQGGRLSADADGLTYWADIGTPERYQALKDSLPRS